jgi:ketosteroid isomerase-like protein
MKHSHTFVVSLGLLALFLLACDRSRETLDDAASTPGRDALRESALQSLQDADEAWDRSTVTADSFVSFFTDDALWLWVDGPRVNGKEEIRTVARRGWARTGSMLDWEPTSIGVNDAYDVGYTAGEWQSSYRAEDGQVVERVGSYMAIWKKGEGGKWTVAIEIEFPGQEIFRNQRPRLASNEVGRRSPTSK